MVNPIRVRNIVKRELASLLGETAAAGDAWWNSLSKKQQAAYIKLHPKSKYAKKAGGASKTEKQKMREATKIDNQLGRKYYMAIPDFGDASKKTAAKKLTHKPGTKVSFPLGTEGRGQGKIVSGPHPANDRHPKKHYIIGDGKRKFSIDAHRVKPA